MKTQTTSAALTYSESKTIGDTIYKVKIRLDDQCGNGHEDFSAAIDYGTAREHRSGNASGGCAHDVILKHFPSLKPFCDLHLSDANGCPMHAAANGFYWYAGTQPDAAVLMPHNPTTGSGAKTPEQCREIFKEHLRCTDADLAQIENMSPRTAVEFSYTLEKLGFRARWKKEAQKAIHHLEKLTGQKFESKATRSQWPKLSPREIAEIETRIASGYYEPEQVAARAAAEAAALRQKKIQALEDDRQKAMQKLENKYAVEMYLATRGIEDGNVIFYDHTNELCFNWSSRSRLWTREEFDAFTQTAEMSELPKGMTFRFQEKPHY